MLMCMTFNTGVGRSAEQRWNITVLTVLSRMCRKKAVLPGFLRMLVTGITGFWRSLKGS